AAGKPAQGQVAVRVRRDGYRVVVSCEDDGRGVPIESVRRVAAESGVVSAAAADSLADEKVFELLFEAGVSTSERVDFVSGRGVGLDVVRDSMTRLKGHARVVSQPGRGTTFTLDVPVSTSSIRTLTVVSGEHAARVDLSAVVSVNRLETVEFSRVGTSLAVLHEGHAVPFVQLDALWGAGDAETLRGAVIVLKSGSEFVALGVETVGGISEVVLHPTPESAGELPVVSGFCLDGDGNPVAVIESKALAGFARGAVQQGGDSAATRKTILVVDDSLTTRMVQQSVLETAGYEVALATSAEEALEMMEANDYGLFLVDVEMPGMNGFELVEHLRSDPKRRDVPCVLVTTLGSADHRRRGIQAGARAYIVKSEFNERELIQIVERLMG
nr:response regulator [Actinomycetes bacterium]